MCGSFGHVAGTSFYPAKPLGCYGDGGAILTDDAELVDVLKSLRRVAPTESTVLLGGESGTGVRARPGSTSTMRSTGLPQSLSSRVKVTN